MISQIKCQQSEPSKAGRRLKMKPRLHRLFLDVIEKKTKKPDGQKSNYVPNNQTGNKCPDGENILPHIKPVHMKPVHHKPRPYPGPERHAQKANRINNAYPRRADF